jgi:hypothetical protein
VYYNCVKFHKTPISRLGGVALTRCVYYTPANKVWGVYRNHPVRPSMYLVSATPPKRLIGFWWNFTQL